MNFIFLRHSIYHQPEGLPSAHLPYSITQVGKQQAKFAADKIIDFHRKNQLKFPSEIECSTLLRAYETAKVIAEEIELVIGDEIRIKQSPFLCERSMGSMANLSVKEIEAIIKNDLRFDSPPKGWKSSATYRLPYVGAESLEDAGKRVANYILNPTKNSNQAYRILVGHGASFRHAAKEMGILKSDEIAKLSMHYAEPLAFEYNDNTWHKVFGKWKIREQTDKID